MLEYIFAKIKMSQHTKNGNTFKKMIEMIFNSYKICNIY